MAVQEAGCPFCREETVEPSIIAESAAFLLLASPCPLAEGHLVLVPRQHVPCYGALPDRLVAEFTRLKEEIAEFLAACYGEPALFEHGTPDTASGHAELHAVPTLAGRHARPFAPGPWLTAPGPGVQALRTLWRAGRPYVYWEERGRSWVLDAGSQTRDALEGAIVQRLPQPATPLDVPALTAEVRVRWQQHRAARTGAEIGLVACVLRRAERICLLLRSPALASAPGKWHVVTGYLPDGVPPLEHAYRELEQETGLAAHQLRLERQAPPLVLQREGDVRRWRVHPFLFELTAGEPRLNWEHVDLRWTAPGEVARFDTVGWLPRLLTALLEPRTEP